MSKAKSERLENNEQSAQENDPLGKWGLKMGQEVHVRKFNPKTKQPYYEAGAIMGFDPQKNEVQVAPTQNPGPSESFSPEVVAEWQEEIGGSKEKSYTNTSDLQGEKGFREGNSKKEYRIGQKAVIMRGGIPVESKIMSFDNDYVKLRFEEDGKLKEKDVVRQEFVRNQPE